MLKASLSSACIFFIFLLIYDCQISSVRASETIPAGTTNAIPRHIRAKSVQACALYSKNNRDLKAKDIREHISRVSRLSHHGHHDHNKVILKPSTTSEAKHVTVHHFNQHDKDSKASYMDWQKRHIGFESYAKRLNLTLVNGTEISTLQSNSATMTRHTVRALKTTTHKNFLAPANDTAEDDNELGITSKHDNLFFRTNNVGILKRNQEVIPLNLAAAVPIKPRNDILEPTQIQNNQLQPQSQRSAISQNIHTSRIISNLQTKPLIKVQHIQPVLIKNTPQGLQGDRQIIPGSQEWNERVQEAHVAQAVQDAERATMYSVNKYNNYTKMPPISNQVNPGKRVTNRVKSFSQIPADSNKLTPRTVLTKVFIIPIQEEISNDNLQSVLKMANQFLDKDAKRSDFKNTTHAHEYSSRSLIKSKKHDMQNVTTPKHSNRETKSQSWTTSRSTVKIMNQKDISPISKKEKRVSKKKSKEKTHDTKKKVSHASNKSTKHKKPASKKKTSHNAGHKKKKHPKHKNKKSHKHHKKKKKKKPHPKHEEEDEEDS